MNRNYFHRGDIHEYIRLWHIGQLA